MVLLKLFFGISGKLLLQKWNTRVGIMPLTWIMIMVKFVLQHIKYLAKYFLLGLTGCIIPTAHYLFSRHLISQQAIAISHTLCDRFRTTRAIETRGKKEHLCNQRVPEGKKTSQSAPIFHSRMLRMSRRYFILCVCTCRVAETEESVKLCLSHLVLHLTLKLIHAFLIT